MVATVALGLAGGCLFWWANLPLPWMLGALTATLIAALAAVPLVPPEGIRPVVVAVIGVLLGSSFTPEVVQQAAGWALSLAFLAVYLVIAAALVVPFYVRVGRMDTVTAFFAAMPGGLNDMMLIGEAMGGDARQIILAHAARIAVTIGAVAVWFRVILGLEVSGIAGLNATGAALGWADAAILVLCGVCGIGLGQVLRLPAPTLIGPMILSAAVHVTGLTYSAPPALLVVAAQVVLGTIMGCRFIGCPPRMVLRALVLALAATVMTLGVALSFAALFHDWFGQSAAQVILAYAPGGLTEMSLVALSMGEDVAYIATHHIARIAMLLGLAPVILVPLARWLGGRD
ncbi:AbrB family transcriptional regulator [Rhodobacteraceae bacterium CCMM004]|nr:AbrB family transcriptional regulator [Rhodobacteraceae bacterium CCMM004]